MAQNGNGVGATSEPGFGIFGSVNPAIDGPWLEWAFTGVGVPATGCFPADPAGPGCGPSSGGNSVFLDAPPWTMTVPFGGATMTVTDAFLYGDSFDVFDNAAFIGATPPVPTAPNPTPPPSFFGCGSDPAVCAPDPLSSTAAFLLAAGPHSSTLTANASPFASGAAYFRIDAEAIVAPIDIKFCSDPNSFNCKKNGVLPVTIFGTTELDVAAIDINTLRLCTDIEGTDCSNAPVSYSVADRGDPLTDLGAEACALDPATGEELDTLNPDAMDDLDVGFVAQEVVGLDVCQGLAKNDVTQTLYLIGYLDDGTPIRSVAANDVGIDQLRKANK